MYEISVVEGVVVHSTSKDDKKWWCKSCQTPHPSNVFRFDFVYNDDDGILYCESMCNEQHLGLGIKTLRCCCGQTSKVEHTFVVDLVNQNAKCYVVKCSEKCYKLTRRKHLEDETMQGYMRCGFCLDGTKSRKKCGRCKAKYYCSLECQRKDWGEHKKECK